MIDIVHAIFDVVATAGFILSCFASKQISDAEHRIENLEAQVRRMYDKIKTLETLNSRR